MYIKRVQLENIRCFEHIEIDFASANDVRKWTVILGDNGVGKTTVLRCIAMGLTDETSASGLLRELEGDMIRFNQKSALIEVELASDEDDNRLVIKTEITRRRSGEPEVKQTPSPKDFPWDRVFACGYGAARRAFGSQAYEKYRLIDSVYTLFNYDAPLQSPEVPFSRLSLTGVDIGELFRRIEHILMLPADSIKYDRSGITMAGLWGSFMPLGSVGDGYAATFAWIADLLGWAMLFQKPSFTADISGIVLVDELEHHLHARWQRRIIKLLRDQFPKIQFIVTTHAPMCAIGTTDLSDRECELIILKREEDRVEGIKDVRPPRSQRADQVLTSYLFGLTTTSDDATKDAIHRYAELISRPRSSSEEEELRDLDRYLNQTVGTAETEIEQRVATAVKQVLQELFATGLAESRGQERLIYLETLRKLRTLIEEAKQ